MPAEKTADNSDIALIYDRVAQRYAEAFYHELENKQFDRELLDRFAQRCQGRGRVCDLGCGPGHVARYLHGRGVETFGIDLSPETVRLARGLNPDIQFETGDMRALDLAAGSLAGIVAFYALIHIERDEVPGVLREMARVLQPGGLLLLAVHGGAGEHHATEFLGEPVSMDATFFERAELAELLQSAGFTIEESLERGPYEFEFPSRRVYLMGSLPLKT
jgi:SAM-dependent methyltransferase